VLLNYSTAFTEKPVSFFNRQNRTNLFFQKHNTPETGMKQFGAKIVKDNI
jgi:hypothetical protein